VLNQVKQFLDSHSVNYQIVEKNDEKPWLDSVNHWIRAVALTTEEISVPPQQFIAILPFNHMLDFNLLTQALQQEIIPLQGEAANRLFNGCKAGIRVPLAELFMLDSILDSSIENSPLVCFEVGNGTHFVEMNGADFVSVCGQSKSSKVGNISFPIKNLYLSKGIKDPGLRDFSSLRIQGRVEQISDLPALPSVALEIIELKANRFATAEDLATIIAKDPVLSALIMGWANSAYYGFQGKITNLKQAISTVLGFDMVLNLSLGIALSQTLKIPEEGPIGLNNYWRQAVLCANLSEKLAMRMAPSVRPHSGLVYLAGLLHNIGHLLLGHSFPPQFYVLNRFIEVNPHIEVSTIEQYILGVSHEQIGAWLLTNWNLPTEIIDATRWHHQEEYACPNAVYSNLILLSNCMLGSLKVGDARPRKIPQAVLELLGLTENQALSAYHAVESYLPDLDSLASQLAA
jgi:HD-like signal output (HDOD) protein/prolyl-tRNA editing enzyme YbaK/EbsC (Cys-tRNA(Pro) deacylase)